MEELEIAHQICQASDVIPSGGLIPCPRAKGICTTQSTSSKEAAMPAEPPRTTVHQVQHLIFDGCRILRTRAADSLAPETLEALDAMIAELRPIEGFLSSQWPCGIMA
jgi:hypothetical protein